MPSATGILAVGFDFATAHADEFHDWYDLEHIPERQAVPGFGVCERWLSVENPTEALAIYDLESLDVLRSEAYKAVAYDNLSPWSKRVTEMCKRLVRFEGTQTVPGNLASPKGAGGFLLNAMNCAPEGEDEFNKWYEEEHLPFLAAVPGTIAARRYVAPDDAVTTHKYLAIYHLESPDVTKTEAWAKAVDTPWTRQVRPHFQDRVRVLAKRYVRGA